MTDITVEFEKININSENDVKCTNGENCVCRLNLENRNEKSEEKSCTNGITCSICFDDYFNSPDISGISFLPVKSCCGQYICRLCLTKEMKGICAICDRKNLNKICIVCIEEFHVRNGEMCPFCNSSICYNCKADNRHKCVGLIYRCQECARVFDTIGEQEIGERLCGKLICYRCDEKHTCDTEDCVRESIVCTCEVGCHECENVYQKLSDYIYSCYTCDEYVCYECDAFHECFIEDMKVENIIECECCNEDFDPNNGELEIHVCGLLLCINCSYSHDCIDEEEEVED